MWQSRGSSLALYPNVDMASTPSMPIRDTQRDRMPIWMWDDEKPKPIGAIDHDGWSYIYYGPHIDYQAAFNLTVFNFAQAANNFANVANAVAAGNAPTYSSEAKEL